MFQHVKFVFANEFCSKVMNRELKDKLSQTQKLLHESKAPTMKQASHSFGVPSFRGAGKRVLPAKVML